MANSCFDKAMAYDCFELESNLDKQWNKDVT